MPMNYDDVPDKKIGSSSSTVRFLYRFSFVLSIL
jgi:hypothetical protein